jgi:hypothetical protein
MKISGYDFRNDISVHVVSEFIENAFDHCAIQAPGLPVAGQQAHSASSARRRAPLPAPRTTARALMANSMAPAGYRIRSMTEKDAYHAQ